MRGTSEVKPRDQLEGGPAQAQAEQHRREGAGDRRQRVVEHRHLDEEPAHPLGLARASSRATLAPSEVPPTTAGGCSRWSSRADHLAGEERHRVEPQVLGPVGAPVAEQVDADHPVAALGQLRPQPLEHAPVHQQPVDQHQHPLALPVGVVLDPVALVAELAHARICSECMPRNLCPCLARSRSATRATRSSPPSRASC